MKELQKIWTNNYVRWGVIVVAVGLLAYFLWKRYQKKKAETEASETKGGTDTATGGTGSSPSTVANRPDKDGTMLAVDPATAKPSNDGTVQLGQNLGVNTTGSAKTKTAAAKAK